MTHELVSAYDMLDQMHVLVRCPTSDSYHMVADQRINPPQRPKRATAESMTRFHTDEYIHFLERVTPETAEQLTYHGNRCESHPSSQSELWLIITRSVSPYW